MKKEWYKLYDAKGKYWKKMKLTKEEAKMPKGSKAKLVKFKPKKRSTGRAGMFGNLDSDFW